MSNYIGFGQVHAKGGVAGVDALRRLSRDADPEVLVTAMLRLWEFGRWLSCGDFETMKNRLEKSGAFSDDDGEILRFG